MGGDNAENPICQPSDSRQLTFSHLPIYIVWRSLVFEMVNLVFGMVNLVFGMVEFDKYISIRMYRPMDLIFEIFHKVGDNTKKSFDQPSAHRILIIAISIWYVQKKMEQ